MQLPVCYNPNITKWPNIGTVFWATVAYGFELDSLCPEVVTANQRACEVRVRDWVESQGTVITRWLGKNKLEYNYDIRAYL